MRREIMQKGEIKLLANYERDSKRYHCFPTKDNGSGVVGTIYVSKDLDPIPEKVIIELIVKDLEK